MREQRPDITIESYLRDVLSALDTPEAEEARKAFEKATIRDFESAQYIADQASQNNVDVFQLLSEDVSGGRYGDFLRERNSIIDQTNSKDAFDRALQLRAPTIPAGTVQLDSQGRFVEGQRADKKVFSTAFEVDQAMQDKKYSRLTDAISSDRTVAERQQERASTFLPATSFTGVQLNTIDSSRAAAALYQGLDEERQFSLIRDFLSAASSNQTANPNYQSTAGADALTAAGTAQALKSAGQLSIAASKK